MFKFIDAAIFVFRYLRTSAALLQHKTYYEILGVDKECSQKEIRNAFVQMSKKFHPDTATEMKSSSNEDFIKVTEAYQVLSKTHSRANYDLSLRGIDRMHFVSKDTLHEPWKIDPTRYAERGPNYSPYYGFRGVNRISNWKIVLACMVFCGFGIMLQATAIIKSVTFKREQLDRSSAIYSANHAKVREEAVRNGNEVQFERLKQRLVKSDYEK